MSTFSAFVIALSYPVLIYLCTKDTQKAVEKERAYLNEYYGRIIANMKKNGGCL